MVRIYNLVFKVLLLALTLWAISTYTSNKIQAYKNNQVFGSPVSMAERERHLTCLAKNIYFEAATEPFEGKVAVAQVTINRAESGKYPSDICDVVYQKNVVYGKIICQFSWYCLNGPTVKHNGLYKESMEVAKKVLLEDFRLPGYQQALWYHAEYIADPVWSKQMIKVGKIGRHIFYKKT